MEKSRIKKINIKMNDNVDFEEQKEIVLGLIYRIYRKYVYMVFKMMRI